MKKDPYNLRYAACILSLLLIPVLMFLQGCSTVGTPHEIFAKSGVQYATMKVIDEDPDRAERVVVVVSTVRAAMQGNPLVSPGTLEEIAREAIDWEKLDGADTVLVNNLIDAVRLELEARVERGQMAEREVHPLDTVLSWVESAAKLSMGGN